ncbi:hypothetical protein SNEBB_004478 [Seison nebaliae]|nr:hypothetical protein SNEBB_004478 [Seison nebaliae]
MPTNTSQRSQYPTHKISLVKNEPERKKVEEIKYIRKIPNEPKSLSEETKSRIIEWLEDSSQSFTKIRNDDNNVVKREIKKVAQRPISLNTAMVKRERYEVRTKSNDAQSGLVDREMLDLKKTEEKRRQQRQFEKEFGLDGPYIQDDYYKWYHAQCHKFNGRSVHEIPTKVIHTTGDTLRKSPIGVLNGLKKDVSSSSFRKKTSHSPFNKQRKPSTPTQTNTSRSSRNFDGKQRISSLSRKKNNSKSLFIVNNDEELKEALTRMEETIRVIREKFNDLEVSDNSKNNLQKSDLKRKLSNIHYLIFQSKTFLSKKV